MRSQSLSTGHFLVIAASAITGVLASAVWCPAQTMIQTIHLRPGWNAVFLKVQPATVDIGELIDKLPILAIREWAPSEQAPVKNFPLRPMTEKEWGPGWLVYTAGAPANTLHALRAGSCYLVELRPDSSPAKWMVHGRPLIAQQKLVPGGDNLVGVSVDERTPPKLAAYFSGSPPLAKGPFHLLGPAGDWVQVQKPDQQNLADGLAIVARCGDGMGYPGPIRIVPEQRGGLDFGRTFTEQWVRFINMTAVKQNLLIKLAPAVPANARGGDVKDASLGDVKLAFWDFRPARERAGWFPLEDGGLTIELLPNGTHDLRLAPRRQDMLVKPETLKERGIDPKRVISENLVFQGIVEVRGAGGATAAEIAVRCAGLTVGAGGTAAGREGLWVGWASITSVGGPAARQQIDRAKTRPLSQQVSNLAATHPATRPEPRPFEVKLLVHVDAQGKAHLLREAIEVFDGGAGRYVLAANEEQARKLIGSSADLGVVGSRFSTTAFGFRDPLPLQPNPPTTPFGHGSLATRVVLRYDDPRSPFVHPFHPDHDNLDERFEKKLHDGAESFTILRDLSLDFTTADPDRLTLAGWGDTQLGGTYRETISGLLREPIVVEGTFRLHRASAVGQLAR